MTNLGRPLLGIGVVLAVVTPAWAQSRPDPRSEPVQWLTANLGGAACVVYEAGPTPFRLERVTENTEVQFEGCRMVLQQATAEGEHSEIRTFRIPLAALAIIPFLTGDVTNHAVGGDFISASVKFYGDTPTTFNQIALGIVWFWVIGWSTYGAEACTTFAPEYHDPKDDTRWAIVSTGGLLTILALLLPITIVGVMGTTAIYNDTTYIAYLTTALDKTVGNFLGGVFVIFISAGLLLSMNTATMDGSRALYGMAREGLTVRQLEQLNRYHVPGRAMALDMVLNLCLLFFAPSLLFILVAGNVGYVLSHVFALSGFLLLRRDRPDWPRPFRLARGWIGVAWVALMINLVCTVFGVIWMKYTGYLVKGSDVTGYFGPALVTGFAALGVGVIGYVIGQKQHGRPVRLTDPSDDAPSPEAYALLAAQSGSG